MLLIYVICGVCSVEQRVPPIFGRRPSRWALAHILVYVICSVYSTFVLFFWLDGFVYCRHMVCGDMSFTVFFCRSVGRA